MNQPEKTNSDKQNVALNQMDKLTIIFLHLG